MKNLFLAMSVLVFIGLVGCNKEELEDIERDVSSLQDSLNLVINQHNALLDSIITIIETMNSEDVIDVNALKMSQIPSLFESIARQPKASNILINATEMLYFDYTMLLPFSDETIEQRGIALVSLFESIARQPEVFNILDSAATKFLGEFNPAYMSNDFVEGRARGNALYGLFENMAKQPEAYSIFDSTATKFLGIYDPSYISEELLETSKAYAMAGLNEGLARQPEADSLFNLLCIKYLNFDFLDKK